MTALALAVASVFALLASLHVFWAFGGRTGWSAALPEVDGRPAFVPGTAITLAVAAALAGCSLLVVATAGLVPAPVPHAWLERAMIALGGVLALRAIGDFRLVGLTKRVRGTRFARLDDTVYSPLCLALAAGVAAIALLHDGALRRP